mmetsp:Transcript_675/g.2255  ORF Transcript_675/g.2255 Transcript_675/m.2255 type:complete len:246 (+) Transcript_675:1566-2303(+)
MAQSTARSPGAASPLYGVWILTGGPRSLPSWMVPSETSQNCMVPSAPAEMRVAMSGLRRRQRTPPYVCPPSCLTTTGPLSCAWMRRTHLAPFCQTYISPLGWPVSSVEPPPGLGGRKHALTTSCMGIFPKSSDTDTHWLSSFMDHILMCLAPYVTNSSRSLPLFQTTPYTWGGSPWAPLPSPIFFFFAQSQICTVCWLSEPTIASLSPRGLKAQAMVARRARSISSRHTSGRPVWLPTRLSQMLT